jgi:hypothetical protein
METLVLGPAVENINYRRTGALHTMLPALVQLSPVNADSLEPQAGENRQALAEGGRVRCPILPTTTTTILLLKTIPIQVIYNNTTQDPNSTFTNKFMNTQKWNSKFINQVNTWDSIKGNYCMKSMSSETSWDTICNLQEATDPANQRAWIGWIQIEDLATTKAHDMIVKIKLEIEAVQYSEIFEGPNFIVLAVPQHELHALTNTTFPPSLHYKICYIPANSKIWATKTNITPTTTNSQIMEGLKKIKGKNTPIGWNVIPTKKELSILIISHRSRNAWLNANRSILIKIRDTAHQLNPDMTNINIQLYTTNKNTSYPRQEWIQWIGTNLRWTQEKTCKWLALFNAFQSTSNFNAAIILLEPKEIELKLANKNEWSTIGIKKIITGINLSKELQGIWYWLKTLNQDGYTSNTNTQTLHQQAYLQLLKESTDWKQLYANSQQEQIPQMKC